jgi:hypothetical protein
MKLELIGHDERYTVEQNLLAFFPEERPSYDPISSGGRRLGAGDAERARCRLHRHHPDCLRRKNRLRVPVRSAAGHGL